MRPRTCMTIGFAVLVGLTMACERTTAPVMSGPFAARQPACDPQKEECQFDGRFTGGAKNITAGGVSITKGFTLHCDIVLSNNLEINWTGGNNWHTDKPFASAVCTDDPTISPEPPPAPFDTFTGQGTGTLNGVPGSVAKIILKDGGEPGGVNDRVQVQIYDAGGALVLDLPLSAITGGNIQAHYDQPHR